MESTLQTQNDVFVSGSMLEILEKIVADSCHCKLREQCPGKSSHDCLKHHNIYAEAMIGNRVTQLK